MANVFVDKQSRNEFILQLWAAGVPAKEVAERLLGPDATPSELKRGRNLIGVVVHNARKAGDHRAAYRYRMPRGEPEGATLYQVTVSDRAQRKLEVAAKEYGLSGTEMIEHLVELIAKDNLFNAVIDDT